MNITLFDKIKLVISAFSTIFKQPMRFLLINLVKPIDAVRYIEFAYLLNFAKHEKIKNATILDVSSPHAIDYILAKQNKIIKINIDQKEKDYIKNNKNLKFELGNAVGLDFGDNTFDLVISISVIEHIYEKYIDAIKEMIRVVRPGGYIYLTFPIAYTHLEEWLGNDIYSDQQRVGGKTFFQYRFSENDVNEIISSVNGINVIHKDIFWESKHGMYDKMIEKLKNKNMNEIVRLLRIPFIHIYYGLFLFKDAENNFDHARELGNIHLVLKKQ